MSEYYTESEARALVGRVFRSKIEYAGIPEGSLGRVVGTYKTGVGDEFGIDIRWNSYSITDGFSKADMDMGMEEYR